MDIEMNILIIKILDLINEKEHQEYQKDTMVDMMVIIIKEVHMREGVKMMIYLGQFLMIEDHMLEGMMKTID
jgi:hypothetical protein